MWEQMRSNFSNSAANCVLSKRLIAIDARSIQEREKLQIGFLESSQGSESEEWEKTTGMWARSRWNRPAKKFPASVDTTTCIVYFVAPSVALNIKESR